MMPESAGRAQRAAATPPKALLTAFRAPLMQKNPAKWRFRRVFLFTVARQIPYD
jgi:hypothetical protein